MSTTTVKPGFVIGQQLRTAAMSLPDAEPEPAPSTVKAPAALPNAPVILPSPIPGSAGWVAGSIGLAALGALVPLEASSAPTLAVLMTATLAALGTAVGAVSYVLGRRPDAAVLEAATREHAALTQTHATLLRDLSAVGEERKALQAATAKLADREQALDREIGDAAQRLIEPERKALADATDKLEAERASIVTERDGALAAEAAMLTAAQVARISDAAQTYCTRTTDARLIMRFVAEPFDGTGASRPHQRMVDYSKVLATLVTNGKVYCGPVEQATDSFYVLPRAGARTITSVRQLCELLRLGTGQDVPGPREG